MSKQQFPADDDRSAEQHEDVGCSQALGRGGGTHVGGEEKDTSFHHFYSFWLLLEQAVLLQASEVGVKPLRSNELLHSNLFEILSGLKGRRMSKSKLPNKR